MHREIPQHKIHVDGNLNKYRRFQGSPPKNRNFFYYMKCERCMIVAC